MFDKGPGDIRICKMFLDLKRRYWDRCFLIIGNRDANKLRLLSELSNFDVEDRPLEEIPAIGCVGCKIKPLLFLKQEKLDNTKVNRLRWLLTHTLGSPGAFEFRREELTIINGKETTDEEVLRSYLDSVNPAKGEDCFVLNYLQLGQLALRINDLLIVHGGINPQSLNYVPDMRLLRYFDRSTGSSVYKHSDETPGAYLSGSEAGQSSLEVWLNELNIFKEEALAEYKENPLWYQPQGQDFLKRGGEALAAYMSPFSTFGRGVSVPTFFDEATAAKGSPVKPHTFPKQMVDFFKASNIRYITVGHKPIGESPLIINASAANKASGLQPLDYELTVIMADTSYSDMPKMSELGHARGIAAHEVEYMMQDSAVLSVRLHGVLPDTEEYDFTFSNEQPGLIGQVTKDNYWVKLRLGNGKYRIARTLGFTVDQHVIEEKVLEELIL